MSPLAWLHCVLLLKEGLVDWAFDFYKMTSHPSHWILSRPLASLSLSLSLSTEGLLLTPSLFPLTSRYTHLLFLCPPDSCPLPPVTLSQDEKRSVWESAERKNRRVNRERDQERFTPGINICRNVAGTRGTHMKKKREWRTLPLLDFCTYTRETCTYQCTHIQKPTIKSYLTLYSIQAGRVVYEWRDHPSTKGLLVQTLMSVIICCPVATLGTESNPPTPGDHVLHIKNTLQLQW